MFPDRKSGKRNIIMTTAITQIWYPQQV